MKAFRALVFIFIAAGRVAAVRAADLNVFAAASLSDALKDIAQAYEASAGDKLRFNLGASSTLAIQIKQGAPADIFFSADEAKMDDLARAGLVLADTRRSLLSYTLVIVVNADRGAAIAAPAGIYAKAYLQKAGLWKKVIDKTVPTENVRACLAAVESGNVDAGIVYKTDALISKKVKIAYEIGVAQGPKISYPLAVMKESRNIDAARRFAAYLASADARAVFTRYGFLPAP